MRKSKVCVIGLHKTGTTSLSVMLQTFGYLVTGPDTNLYYDYMNENFENIDEFIDNYDAFQDDPWYNIFEYIDAKIKDVKFIYLWRDEKSWLKSVQRFYGTDRYNNKVRRHFYGDPDSLKNPELYLKKFKSHEQRVLDYFEGKKNFIKIDVRNPDDAIALQKFLRLPQRYTKFPLANKFPTTQKEEQIKNTRLLIKGYFGLNKVFKFILRKTFGFSRYVEIRSKIRYQRALFKKFKIQMSNSLFKK